MRHHTQPSTASGIVMRWLCSCALGMHLVQVHRLCDRMGVPLTVPTNRLCRAWELPVKPAGV
jgi:hypothetical protein